MRIIALLVALLIVACGGATPQQAEPPTPGCYTDDTSGVLYYNEEHHSLWVDLDPEPDVWLRGHVSDRYCEEIEPNEQVLLAQRAYCFGGSLAYAVGGTLYYLDPSGLETWFDTRWRERGVPRGCEDTRIGANIVAESMELQRLAEEEMAEEERVQFCHDGSAELNRRFLGTMDEALEILPLVIQVCPEYAPSWSMGLEFLYVDDPAEFLLERASAIPSGLFHLRADDLCGSRDTALMVALLQARACPEDAVHDYLVWYSTEVMDVVSDESGGADPEFYEQANAWQMYGDDYILVCPLESFAVGTQRDCTMHHYVSDSGDRSDLCDVVDARFAEMYPEGSRQQNSWLTSTIAVEDIDTDCATVTDVGGSLVVSGEVRLRGPDVHSGDHHSFVGRFDCSFRPLSLPSGDAWQSEACEIYP